MLPSQINTLHKPENYMINLCIQKAFDLEPVVFFLFFKSGSNKIRHVGKCFGGELATERKSVRS